ncbi:MAG TPA: serine/threonine-protein kinase [Steroidobacter sp.]|nr:serine/threonine-protein kinase [Steroidobacter sp.]
MNFESGQALSAGFTLLRRLGAGGGAEVWLVQDRLRGRPAAVKLFAPELARNPDALRMLEREYALVRRLHHPNILRVHGLYRSGERAWLVMDYAPGGDLTRLRGGEVEAIIRAARQVAAALAYAHRAGLVHRDVKSSNVLLSHEGAALLADFGTATALTIGDGPAAVGGGSPYSMSPQQLDGRPASPADDVYGLGAMLYELLTGYPPFYPHATPDRIRRELPAPPASAPPALAALVCRMLAKRATERPDIQTVERELEAALGASLGTGMSSSLTSSIMSSEQTHQAVRIEPPALRPPPGHGEPLKGEWRRTSAAGASAAEIRRGQDRRRRVAAAAIAVGLAGVLFVFVGLPRWVGQDDAGARHRQATSAQDVAAAAQPDNERKNVEEIDFAALARAKQRVDEIRAPLENRLQQLVERAAERWGAADFRQASAQLAAADAAYQQREYQTSLQHFERMAPLLDALEKRAGEVLREQLATGDTALQEGRSEDAAAAFALALNIEPQNAHAEQGLKRAGVLDEVLRLLAEAERLENAGQMEPALAGFRKALALDAQTSRAAEGVARIEGKQAADAFASAMARGYAAMANADYASARSAFEAARGLRPQAPEIAQALAQIEQEQRTETIAAKLREAQELEGRERWVEALREYRAVLELDSTIVAANQGVQRASPRAALHEEIELYLTQPERLFSKPVRAAAAETIERARSVPDRGPVLQRQIAKLEEWVARAGQPVQVALRSDNLTHVTVYRVGELGAFGERSLTLEPGRYTIVGTRPGYRDVRRQIDVAPGAALEPVVIRCEDRI